MFQYISQPALAGADVLLWRLLGVYEALIAAEEGMSCLSN